MGTLGISTKLIHPGLNTPQTTRIKLLIAPEKILFPEYLFKNKTTWRQRTISNPE
jgi:hypothetical protein